MLQMCDKACHAVDSLQIVACKENPYLDHKPGVQAVEGGISAIGKGPDGVRELPLLWDEVGDLLHEGCIAAVLLTVAINVSVVARLLPRVVLSNH